MFKVNNNEVIDGGDGKINKMVVNFFNQLKNN